MRLASHSLVILTLLALAGPARAQAPAKPAPPPAPSDKAERADYIRSHYTKFEYRIPMRDGVRLFTAVYVPNDASASKRYPLLLTRTPYSVGPYGADRYKEALGPSAAYEKEGFIFAFQDVRGEHMSEGESRSSPRRAGPRTSTRAPTRTTPSTGW